jgi:hypothetical protein
MLMRLAGDETLQGTVFSAVHRQHGGLQGASLSAAGFRSLRPATLRLYGA